MSSERSLSTAAAARPALTGPAAYFSCLPGPSPGFRAGFGLHLRSRSRVPRTRPPRGAQPAGTALGGLRQLAALVNLALDAAESGYILRQELGLGSVPGGSQAHLISIDGRLLGQRDHGPVHTVLLEGTRGPERIPSPQPPHPGTTDAGPCGIKFSISEQPRCIDSLNKMS